MPDTELGIALLSVTMMWLVVSADRWSYLFNINTPENNRPLEESWNSQQTTTSDVTKTINNTRHATFRLPFLKLYTNDKYNQDTLLSL